MNFPVVFVCLLLVLAEGCGSLESAPIGETPTAAIPSATPALIIASTPEETQESNSSGIQTIIQEVNPTDTPASAQVCSPLHGFQLVQLADIISTPYDPPLPGQDSGHHGVDFGFYSYGAFTQMEGLPVQSILSGFVAAVVEDRPPYGNMIIVETPQKSLPQSWQDYIVNLPPLEEYQFDGRLACPEIETVAESDRSKSIYVLYAHLSVPPAFSIGDPIGCGQQIGFVGTTGFSVNAHLHLETRLGPAQVQFLHLAHYVNNASVEEMANYCTWRIGRDFRLIDPMELLQLAP